MSTSAKYERPSPAYLLMLFSALYVWYMQQPDKIWLSIICVVLILLSYVFKFHINHSRLIQTLVIAFIFSFSYLILHGGDDSRFVAIYSTGFVHPLVSAIVISIVYQWYSPRSQNLNWLLFSIGGVLIFSTISWAVTGSMLKLVGAVCVFIIGVILNQSLQKTDKKTQKISKRYSLGGFLITLSIVILTSVVSIEYQKPISPAELINFIRNRLPSAQKLSLNWTNFSQSTTLSGQYQANAPNNIVIKVESKQALDHLRGGILTHYQRGKWSPPKVTYQPAGALMETPEESTLKWHQLTPSTQNNQWNARFFYLGFYEGIIFMPTGTQAVGLNREKIEQNQYLVTRQKMYEDFPVYELKGIKSPSLPMKNISPHMLKENLQIPSDVERQLHSLAQKITQGAKTDLEKARKVEQWFKSNFKYTLTIGNIPSHVDPTVYFIEERMPAFCSWFASGMTLMLRSLNIPAHLVNGWLNMEYNSMGGFWVIREREAHAWVEVLDKAKQEWVTFDPTSSEQLESVFGDKSSPGWEQMKDSFSLKIKQWLQYMTHWFKSWDFENLWKKWLKWFEEFRRNSSWGYTIIPLVLIIQGFLLFKLFKWLKRTNQIVEKDSKLEYSGASNELMQVMRRFEELLENYGITTAPHLTLNELIVLTHKKTQLSELQQKNLSQIASSLQDLRYGEYRKDGLTLIEAQLEKLESETLLNTSSSAQKN